MANMKISVGTKSELLNLCQEISFDQTVCSVPNTPQRYLSLRMPDVLQGHTGYTVSYCDYSNGSNVHITLNYKLSDAKLSFVHQFTELFSSLSNIDILYVADKIWSISSKHNEAYKSHKKVSADQINAKNFAVLSKKKSIDIKKVSDEPIIIDDVFVSKTLALIGRATLTLCLGDFNFKSGKLDKTGQNLYSASPKDFEYLKSLGLLYDPPQNLGGWQIPTSEIDEVVQITRSISDDIELKKYIAEELSKNI